MILQTPLEISPDTDVHRAIQVLRTLMQNKAAAQGAEVPTFAVVWLTTTDTDYQSACVVFGDTDPDIMDDLAEAMLGGGECDESFEIPRSN